MSSNEESTEAELAELKAERDALAAQVAALEDRPAKRQRTRRVVTAILVIVSVLAFSLAVPGTWVRRTLGDTDRYVATITPLPSDPAVQEYLARTITTSVFDALGVQERSLGVRGAGSRSGSRRRCRTRRRGSRSSRGRSRPRSRASCRSRCRADRHPDVRRSVDLGEPTRAAGHQGRAERRHARFDLRGAGRRRDQPPADHQQGVGPGLDDRHRPDRTAGDDPARSICRRSPRRRSRRSSPRPGSTCPRRSARSRCSTRPCSRRSRTRVSLAQRLLLAAVLLLLLATIGALWLSTRRRRTLIQIMTAWTVVLVIERRARDRRREPGRGQREAREPGRGAIRGRRGARHPLALHGMDARHHAPRDRRSPS